ncbi:MAG TPA: 50S ribosomal protein L10 [Dehalococcoidia bacterium]|nr:50S ribosomal protein L10 [Dehalococcoidia bacterium]
MPKPEKVAKVQEIQDRLERATMAVSTEYRGLTVQEMTDLRRRLRAAGLEVKVVKNTLLRIAAEQTEKTEVMRIIEGPTAMVFAYEDAIAAAKALTEYAQSAPSAFSIRGAYLDGTVVDASALRDLVTIPPRPVLLGQIMGQLQSPLATTAALLQSPLQEFSRLLNSLLGELPGLVEARARQMEAS